MSTTPRTDAQHELRDIDKLATSYFRLLDFARGLERELNNLARDYHQPELFNEKIYGLVKELEEIKAAMKLNCDALGEVTRKVAGHIEKPYSAEEIAAMIESGDYSAELVMQHLLLLIAEPPAT